MPDNRSKQNFESWSGGRCHPNAPAGGGGPGNFTQAGPLHFGGSTLPHPGSPAGRYLTPEKIRTPGFMERVQSLVEAYKGALRLAPAAVYQETGYQLGQILDSLLPGLLQMLAILGISVVVGAGAGATIGFFLGGVGAAPGAVVGGELGLEVGTAVLTWMGLGFLAIAIGESLGELTNLLTRAISRAWHAAEQNHPKFEIETAAHELAQTAGILFRLILQGILAYVLKKGAVSSSKAAVSTGQTIIKGGTQAAADETLAEVSALLKKSKLPDGFIVWIEKNWEDLKQNPKLMRQKTANTSRAEAASTAETPSQLKRAGKNAEAAEEKIDHKTPISQSRVSTKPNTAHFWSGKSIDASGQKIGGANRAADIAKQNGGTTLEMLIEERKIQMPDWDPNNPSTIKAWDDISAEYANGASGEVKAIVGNELRPGNVWQTKELPALLKNPNVTKITTIDPATGLATVIFP